MLARWWWGGGIASEEHLRPARVMGIPATVGLLGSMASITVSAVLAALRAYQG
jgi:hypothetical protein